MHRRWAGNGVLVKRGPKMEPRVIQLEESSLQKSDESRSEASICTRLLGVAFSHLSISYAPRIEREDERLLDGARNAVVSTDRGEEAIEVRQSPAGAVEERFKTKSKRGVVHFRTVPFAEDGDPV